jgi:hypothetical protein
MTRSCSVAWTAPANTSAVLESKKCVCVAWRYAQIFFVDLGGVRPSVEVRARDYKKQLSGMRVGVGGACAVIARNAARK